MNKVLEIEQTDETPYVKISLNDKVFECTGKSLSCASYYFYQPIISFLEENKDSINNLHCTVKMKYINSQSNKLLLDIFKKIAKTNSIVYWHYKLTDEDMLEIGVMYAELADILFVFNEY